jgi:hypothetical protein
MVRRTGQAQWRPTQENDDRGARPKAAGCALETLWKYVAAGVVIEGAVLKAT